MRLLSAVTLLLMSVFLASCDSRLSDSPIPDQKSPQSNEWCPSSPSEVPSLEQVTKAHTYMLRFWQDDLPGAKQQIRHQIISEEGLLAVDEWLGRNWDTVVASQVPLDMVWRHMLCAVLPDGREVLVGGGIGWLYWEWWAEQPVYAKAWRIKNSGMVMSADSPVQARRIGPPWMAKLLGNQLSFLLDRVQRVNLAGPQVTADDLHDLRYLKYVEILWLSHSPANDRTLEGLAGHRYLRLLDLSSTQVTDQGLTHLAGMQRLEELRLSHTTVTADGLRHLAGLTRLKLLVLHPEQVSYASLDALKQMVSLRELIIDTGYDPMSNDPWDAYLRKELPKTRISYTLMTP